MIGKPLLSIFLITIATFSGLSYGKWSFAAVGTGEINKGTVFYIGLERIRYVDGQTFFWVLADYKKPSSTGDLSHKVYMQAECRKFRFKHITWSFHKKEMGMGPGETLKDPDQEWTYPTPDSVYELLLDKACRA